VSEEDSLEIERSSPPPSALILNPQLQTDSEPADTSDQQQKIIIVQAPVFKHPSRLISSIVTTMGLVVFFLAFFAFSGSSTTNFDMLEFGFGGCCLLFNFAFIMEIVYYANLIAHNNTYGIGNGWANFNLVLTIVLVSLGLLIFTSNFVF
jgi:hypothetical protein